MAGMKMIIPIIFCGYIIITLTIESANLPTTTSCQQTHILGLQICETSSMPFLCGTYFAIIVIVMIVPNILLIMGVKKKAHAFFLPWLCVEGLFMVFYSVILFGFVFVMLFNFSFLYFVLCASYVSFYTIMVHAELAIFNLHKKYKNDQGKVTNLLS